MKSTEPVQVKGTKQQVEGAAAFFRLFAEAQQALAQLMTAPENNATELNAFREILAKLQSNISTYLEIPATPAPLLEIKEESAPSESAALPEAKKEEAPTHPIANRVLRELLRTQTDIVLSQHINEKDIQLFNLLFEPDRRKALTQDLGLQGLSEEQIAEILLGDEELGRIQQLKNRAIEQYLVMAEGPALWGITDEHISELNATTDIVEQKEILDTMGITDLPDAAWLNIAKENARFQCLEALNNRVFNALFAEFPNRQIPTDEDGNVSMDAQAAVEAIIEMNTQPMLDRTLFEMNLDLLGMGHDWLDQPADEMSDTGQTWWQWFQSEQQRIRGAYHFVDPTLRELILSDPQYVVQEPINTTALVTLNKAKSTILRGEYLSALHILVPRLILDNEQFEQITAFLQALDYLKKAVSIDVISKVEAVENTLNRLKKEPITQRGQLDQHEQKVKLLQDALKGLEEYFINDLTQDIVDITFSALDTVNNLRSVFPEDTLLKFFEMRRQVRAYQKQLMILRDQSNLPEQSDSTVTLSFESQQTKVIETKSVPAAQRVPENVAAGIQLSKNAKWESLLEQTEEAVKQVADRFGWTETPDKNDPNIKVYMYGNGLKVTYSKNGISYYERNLDDAQISEELKQKEIEMAYAWVELVRPSILVEPVILSGQSKEMLGHLISEFKARQIQVVLSDDSSGTRGPSKGFFQNLTDAARRLDQFGRYLDKGR